MAAPQLCFLLEIVFQQSDHRTGRWKCQAVPENVFKKDTKKTRSAGNGGAGFSLLLSLSAYAA
ncbi:hypothetical protein [Lachnoclostridium sp. Marseille-P6806]|uniref:hypothetical protein n=1 Tax=Lachnoclostridium sp. Marseille-P6806 TaxID=2364793 RepID=UPI0010318099|nr:hypothetical protein [Lachnoclostridium sp. Marseille-P6806]